MADKPVTDARRVLLEGLVDFAGLFPPASRPMKESVGRYEEYRRGAQAWALGKFVLPVARLEEFATEASRVFGSDNPFSLAVIASADFEHDSAAIEAFEIANGRFATIDAIEVKGSTAEGIASIARIAAALRASLAHPVDVYVEVPVAADPSPLVAAIGVHGLRAKVRTGGIEAGAFPTAEQVARFLNACTAYDVTFKATAGLHHAVRGVYPLTYDRGSERSVMFGFLNLFLAAPFVRDGLGTADTIALLEESDAGVFTFSAAGVTWRGRTVTAQSIRASRQRAATSFGSCSFAEPVADLSTLGLL